MRKKDLQFFKRERKFGLYWRKLRAKGKGREKMSQKGNEACRKMGIIFKQELTGIKKKKINKRCS